MSNSVIIYLYLRLKILPVRSAIVNGRTVSMIFNTFKSLRMVNTPMQPLNVTNSLRLAGFVT